MPQIFLPLRYRSLTHFISGFTPLTVSIAMHTAAAVFAVRLWAQEAAQSGLRICNNRRALARTLGGELFKVGIRRVKRLERIKLYL